MEQNDRRKKQPKKNKEVKQSKKNKEVKQSSSDERVHLQELNKILPRTNTKVKNKSGSNFSYSTSTSIEDPRGCLRSLLSSHSNPSSSASRSNLQRKPTSLSRDTNENKPLATATKSAPNITILGSKPSKPSSLKSNKNPFSLPKCQSSKKTASKTPQRLKLSAGLSNSLNGSDGYGVSKREGQGLGESTEFNPDVPDNLIDFENSTPVGKALCGPGLNYAMDDDNPVGVDSNSANTIVKTTPPVEASVSPEIQGGSSIAVLTSTTTPVCYGAGHLISGVTDKRKCRSRGILTVRGESGFEKVSSYDDSINENADNVLFNKSRNSLTPLPAEASMSWLLSPFGKKDEVRKDDGSSNSCRQLGLASICVSSSPSFCQFSPHLVSDSGDETSNGNSDAMTGTGKTRIFLLSPRRVSNCRGLSEISSEKEDVDSSGTSQAKTSGKAVHLPKEIGCSHRLIGEKSSTCIDHLSCSNVVKTPNSNTSSERLVCISRLDEQCFNRQEFSTNHGSGSVAQDFQRASLSPKSQISMWDPTVLSPPLANLDSRSHFTDVVELKKKWDTCASWISDSTLENMSLSQMRISWREGLASPIFDVDEVDCCRCLSDEENNGEGSSEFQHKSLQALELRNNGLRSPEFLEKELQILRKGKEILSPVGPNVCAESISTDASCLVASGDSDWTLCYKNHLFGV